MNKPQERSDLNWGTSGDPSDLISITLSLAHCTISITPLRVMSRNWPGYLGDDFVVTGLSFKDALDQDKTKTFLSSPGASG